ncbi:MAG: cysteine peptidase family C39 domain-containing protein [Isosphaeraceae bacterium]|nr:cysteine peptidase family C39 domain-containing protein [Isosphaeraceae bacterium]
MGLRLAVLSASCLVLCSHGVRAQTGADEKPIPEAFCGGYALSVAFEAMGIERCSPEQVLDALGEPANGYSIAQLEAEAKRRGLHTLMVRTSLDNLRWRKEPLLCVTLILNRHFVVLHDLSDRFVQYVDYPRNVSIPIETWDAIWEGNSLLLSRVELEAEESIGRRRMLRQSAIVGTLVCLALAVIFRLGQVGRRVLERRRAVASLVVVLLLASGCGSRTDLDATAPGELRMEPNSIDLGTLVIEDHPEPIPVKALIVNETAERVHLEKLELSCTCTDAALKQRDLDPGKTSTLEALIEPGSTTGIRSAVLKVTTDSEQSPSLAFVVRWNLVSRLSLEPGEADFGRMNRLPSTEKRLKITSRGFQLCPECRLTFEPTSSAIKATSDLDGVRRGKVGGHEAPTDAHEFGLLILQLTGTASEGSHREAVSIRCVCNGNELIRYNLPVFWELAPRVALHPSRLFLARKDERLAGRVILQSDVPVRVLNTGTEGGSKDKVRIHYSRASSDRHFLDIEVQTPLEKGTWRSDVVLELDHPEVSRLVLPITALIGD